MVRGVHNKERGLCDVQDCAEQEEDAPSSRVFQRDGQPRATTKDERENIRWTWGRARRSDGDRDDGDAGAKVGRLRAERSHHPRLCASNDRRGTEKRNTNALRRRRKGVAAACPTGGADTKGRLASNNGRRVFWRGGEVAVLSSDRSALSPARAPLLSLAPPAVGRGDDSALARVGGGDGADHQPPPIIGTNMSRGTL